MSRLSVCGSLKSYNACFKCKGKIAINEDDDEMGQCMRCDMIQFSSGEETATMATPTLITLKAFDNVLKKIRDRRTLYTQVFAEDIPFWITL